MKEPKSSVWGHIYQASGLGLNEPCSPEPSPVFFLCLTIPPLFLQMKEGYLTFGKQLSNTVTVLHSARYERRMTDRQKVPSLPLRMGKVQETSICTATYQMYAVQTELRNTLGMDASASQVKQVNRGRKRGETGEH